MESYRNRYQGVTRGRAAALLLMLGVACGGGGAADPTAPGEPPDGMPIEPPDGTPVQPPAPPPATVPLSALIDTPDKYFVPPEVTIAAGGTVTWRGSDNRHEIHFEGTAPPGGDIPLLGEGMEVTRTFPVPGTYRFRCARHGDAGAVHVVDGVTPPPETPRPPVSGGVTITTPGVSFSPATATIAAGGTVTWQFTGTRHNVVFRGAAPEGGNIPDTDAGRSVSRTFTVPGTYDYDCTRHSGMSGRITVQ